jgi:hypothetical protein
MTNSLKQLVARIPVDRVNNMVDSMHNSMNEPRLGYILDHANPVDRWLSYGNCQEILGWPDYLKNCNC